MNIPQSKTFSTLVKVLKCAVPCFALKHNFMLVLRLIWFRKMFHANQSPRFSEWTLPANERAINQFIETKLTGDTEQTSVQWCQIRWRVSDIRVSDASSHNFSIYIYKGRLLSSGGIVFHCKQRKQFLAREFLMNDWLREANVGFWGMWIPSPSVEKLGKKLRVHSSVYQIFWHSWLLELLSERESRSLKLQMQWHMFYQCTCQL